MSWTHGGKEGLSLSALMALLNYEPNRVELKGAYFKWAPKWLVMTSTTPFSDWYSYIDKDGNRICHGSGMLACPICQQALESAGCKSLDVASITGSRTSQASKTRKKDFVKTTLNWPASARTLL